MLFNIYFIVFGFLILLSFSFPYHYLFFFFFFFFQFGLFDGCLIISLIDSLIFPITNMWFEIMGVCATHILSPIVSYGLKWWRYIFVSLFFLFFLFFFFFFFFIFCVCVCGYQSGLKSLTDKFQQTSNYALLAFYLYSPLECGYLMFVIRIVFMNFMSFWMCSIWCSLLLLFFFFLMFVSFLILKPYPLFLFLSLFFRMTFQQFC